MRRSKTIEELIEYQAAWQDVRRRLEIMSRSVRPDDWPGGPWITISRQLGSGGNEMAGKLAEALGWELLDRQIVAEIARREHSTVAAIAAHDERATSAIHDYLSYLLVPNDPGVARFREEMIDIIRSRAAQGRVVILGRGANWFLDPRNGLRLRVVAALEDRAQLLARREQIDLTRAKRLARESDENQKQFIKQSCDRDVDDPLGYDLVLNMSAIGSTLAAEIVAAALEKRLAASA